MAGGPKLELEGDEATGANIVRKASSAPLKQIAINAGLEGGVVADKPEPAGTAGGAPDMGDMGGLRRSSASRTHRIVGGEGPPVAVGMRATATGEPQPGSPDGVT